MRTAGRVYPALEKLRRALELRAWTNGDLAEKSGISMSAAQRVTVGKPVSPETIDRVSRALLENPPASTPTGSFVLDEAAN